MSNESKEKALPGYKSLAEVQKKQIKLLENIDASINEMVALQAEGNIITFELLTVEKCRKKHDKESGKRGFWFSVVAIGIAAIALTDDYLRNPDRSILQMLGSFIYKGLGL